MGAESATPVEPVPSAAAATAAAAAAGTAFEASTSGGWASSFFWQLAGRIRPDDAAALLVEHCFAEHGARRALYAAVDAEDGSLAVRFTIGFDAAAQLRLPLPRDDLPIVRAALRGAAMALDGPMFLASGLGAGAFREQPAGHGAVIPLVALPMIGSTRGAIQPRCALYRTDHPPRSRCYLQKQAVPDQGVPEWETRLKTLCSDCPVFGASGVVVVEREAPFSEAEIDALAMLGLMTGARTRTLQAIEREDRAIDRLKKEREWVDTVMVSAADPIVVTDRANALVLQNRRAEELLVAEAEDSVGKRRAIAINDITFSAYLSSLSIDPKRAPRELLLVHPIDGTDLLFEAISSPAYASDGTRIGLVTVMRDITDLQKATQEGHQQVHKARRAEAAMRQERDRLSLILKSAVEPIVVTNPSNEIVMANSEGERLFQEARGDSAMRRKAVVFNDANFSSCLTEFGTDLDLQRKRELKLRDPATDEVRSFEITMGKIRNERGQSIAVVSVFHDLTKLRELERRRLEQKLFDQEKAAATGRLAASIAHEVNNPLEAIKNSLYLLRTRLAQDESAAKFLDIARRESERVSNIVKQFLGFYRPAMTMLPVDVGATLEYELKLLENQIEKRGIRVLRQLGPTPKVVANEDQLKQVFLNLILNALEAMPEGGTLTVATRHEVEATALTTIAPSVRVTIGDTGGGISPEHRDSLFEPFFTTKKERGTGLGLWVSFGIVKAHNGDIKVETDVGLGTRFHVILPAS